MHLYLDYYLTPDIHSMVMTDRQGNSSSSAELPSQTAWSVAHDLHRGNFVTVVEQDVPIYLRLFRRLRGHSESPMTGYHVNIAEMQRMRLRALQYDLVQMAVDLHIGNDLSQTDVAGHGNKMKLLLGEYTQAVRDYEYMCKVSQQPFDYFVASSGRYHDRHVLGLVRRSKDVDVEEFADPSRSRSAPKIPWETIPEPLGGTRNASAKKEARRSLWWKCSGAMLAGSFLIGPMWFLVLHQELYKSLGVATAFVSAFGFLMAFFANSLEGVFAATLAYAAVIMVFVGVMFDKQFTDTG